jgi:uncharacterized protein YjbI with pentapeptide repeats
VIAQSGGWIAGVTAVVALLGAVLGLLRYFNYRTKQDRIAAVGSVFETVVAALASKSETEQLAAAIRLRRFFDPKSEFGKDEAPYSSDALGVIIAILREQRTGNLQKLLADGLTHAPTLAGADLQRTNLQGAYLGGTNVSEADFYRADLSTASLKNATARKAKFYQAKLVDTVFTGADLRGANFYEADLTRVKFGEAKLTGATFVGSRPIPQEVALRLDESGRFIGPEDSDERMPPDVPAAAALAQIFVSRPSTLTPSQQTVWRLIEDTVEAVGADVVIFGRSDYPPAGVLSDLRRVMEACRGVIILGFRQLEIHAGCWRSGTPEERSVDGAIEATPWNQVEAGIAAALRLPLFVVRDSGVTGGIFDIEEDAVTVVADIDKALERNQMKTSLQGWLIEVTH